MQRALDNDAEDVPAGWLRRDEILHRMGYKTYNGGKKQWLRMKRTGVMETKQFRIRVGNKVMPVPHYRVAGS